MSILLARLTTGAHGSTVEWRWPAAREMARTGRLMRATVTWFSTALVIGVTPGCFGFAPEVFARKMDALKGQEVSVLTEAWGPAHNAVRCREVNRRWGLQRKEMVRRVCEWEKEGVSAYVWTLVSDTYDERQSTPDAQRLTLPCSVVVAVKDGVIHAWEVAPYQQCQDYRAVDAVPPPRGNEDPNGT